MTPRLRRARPGRTRPGVLLGGRRRLRAALHGAGDAAALGAEDATVHGDSAGEKASRGAPRAAVERRLSLDAVVPDSLHRTTGRR